MLRKNVSFDFLFTLGPAGPIGPIGPAIPCIPGKIKE